MEEFDNAIDPDNDISYGISSKGHEVMIVNEREIFVKRKIGKRTLNNNYTIGWSCKNKPSCTASISSTRDDVNLEASDYQHSIYCSISRTDVVVLKHLNYLMEQCKEPGVNQQIAYEDVKISVELHYRNKRNRITTNEKYLFITNILNR